MKKVVFGCLGVLVLVAMAGAAGAYYFVWRPAKAMIASVTQLQEWPRLDARVRNKSPFTPPAGGELSVERVQRFVDAQKRITDRLGARVKELDAKFEAMTGGDPNYQGTFRDTMTAIQDLGSLVLEAKRIQVDVLNEHQFSLEEYDWVKRSVYAAAGIPVATDMSALIQRASRGELDSAESALEAATGAVPDLNRQLVAPHVKLLTDNAGLAFFGL